MKDQQRCVQLNYLGYQLGTYASVIAESGRPTQAIPIFARAFKTVCDDDNMLRPMVAYVAALNRVGHLRSASSYCRRALLLIKRKRISATWYTTFYNDGAGNRLTRGMSALDDTFGPADGGGAGPIPDDTVRESKAFALFVSAIQFGKRGNFDRSKRLLMQSTERAVEFPDPSFVLGVIDYHEGHVSKAAAAWTQSLTMIAPIIPDFRPLPSPAQIEAVKALCSLRT